jgi:hypothetical protein
MGACGKIFDHDPHEFGPRQSKFCRGNGPFSRKISRKQYHMEKIDHWLSFPDPYSANGIYAGLSPVSMLEHWTKDWIQEACRKRRIRATNLTKAQIIRSLIEYEAEKRQAKTASPLATQDDR